MPLDIYDRFGDAIAYSDDGEHIYLFSGEAVCYLVAEAIYCYHGEQLGWYEDGWIRDKRGRCVAFSQWAVDGPRQIEINPHPTQSPRQPRPTKELCDPRVLRPTHSNAWSEIPAQDFFSPRSHTWAGGMGSGDGRPGRGARSFLP